VACCTVLEARPWQIVDTSCFGCSPGSQCRRTGRASSRLMVDGPRQFREDLQYDDDDDDDDDSELMYRIEYYDTV